MRIARVFFFFLSIQFFLYNMGLLGRSLSLLASAAALFVFIALSLPGREYRLRGVHVLSVLGLVIALIVIARGSYEEVFAFPVLLSSLLLLPARRDHGSGERETLVVAAFLYSAVVLLQFHAPAFWYIFHVWGLKFSQAAGRLIGQPYLLGQTASGLPILLLFLSYHLAAAVFAGNSGLRYFIKTLFLSLVLQAVLLVLLTPLAIFIQLRAPSWDLLLLNPQAFILAGLLLTFTVKIPAPAAVRSSPGFRLPVLLGFIALVCSIWLSLRPVPGSSDGRILIYDKGYMNWRIPEYGRYGHKSGGMFGYLPAYLEAAGHDVEKVDELSRSRLEGASAVIVINVLEYFSDSEKEAVTDFVKGGGGLLALGDHTGVQGIRGPFNDLLDPFRIEFLFDSATFLTKGWGEAAVPMPHPTTHGLYSPQEMDIWVGASLRIRPPARPVVVAKYGYSDFGDITAISHAFLGNRVFDTGEQLGDLVLVAANDYGKGRVLVFGDTSSFQNGAMVTSYRFVARVASWLVSGGSYGPVRSAVLPIVIGVIAILTLVRKNAHLAGVVSAAILIGSFIGLAPRRIAREVELDMPTAVVDQSHFERFDLLTWYDDCTGGLQYNLMRAGYFPLLTRRFSGEQIMESDVVAIIAPVKPFTGSESEVLERFMQKGGWILYSCGTEERKGSLGFLERHGLSLLEVPLTNFADTLGGAQLRVNEGWGVEVRNPDARVFSEKFGFPYIVEVRMGKGGMVFIADSSFLLNKNLEGMEEYYAGNIMFLKKLFGGFRGGSPADSLGLSEKVQGVSF